MVAEQNVAEAVGLVGGQRESGGEVAPLGRLVRYRVGLRFLYRKRGTSLAVPGEGNRALEPKMISGYRYLTPVKLG